MRAGLELGCDVVVVDGDGDIGRRVEDVDGCRCGGKGGADGHGIVTWLPGGWKGGARMKVVGVLWESGDVVLDRWGSDSVSDKRS